METFEKWFEKWFEEEPTEKEEGFCMIAVKAAWAECQKQYEAEIAELKETIAGYVKLKE